MAAKIKFQEVSFRGVDEFLAYLPENELIIVELLRKIVLDCLPDCIEKLAYNVPYYKINKNICFIWPASVKWGKTISFQGVRFGFPNGNLLADEENYLDKGQRTQVYWKNFTSLKSIDAELLRSYIFEAVLIDKQFKKSGKNT
jgi:hypothetical protein